MGKVVNTGKAVGKTFVLIGWDLVKAAGQGVRRVLRRRR